MSDLRVSLLQQALHWENPAANRAQFEAAITELRGTTDLVVLPEMFTTGFSMATEYIAEPAARDTLPWLQAMARHTDAAICGSLAVRDGKHVFNRLLFVTPEGTSRHYDKKHCFRMSGEHRHYDSGGDKLIVPWCGWKICPQICYDLRFPVWLRNRPDDHPEHYDLLLFVANWPAKRRLHWRQLLIARAIENQACCLGLNRVGTDDNGLDYAGDSLVLRADGEVLLDCEDRCGTFTTTLERAALEIYREKFPCHKDADSFSLTGINRLQG